MLKNWLKPCLLVVACGLSIDVFAAGLPVSGVSIKLVPGPSAADNAPKIIDVDKTKTGMRVKWFSLVKTEVSDAYFPTYKVRASRGVIDIDGLSGKTAFFSPALWTQGYAGLTDSLPLWLPPEMLALTGKRPEPFQPGFLGVKPDVLKAAPDRVYEMLLYFQKLYDHFVVDGDVVKRSGLTSDDRKEMKTFVKAFFSLGLVAKTKASLVVNKQTRSLDAKIFGNPYLQFVVLDDVQNPLIISFHILKGDVPAPFEKVFDFLKNNFEYQVTQVNY